MDLTDKQCEKLSSILPTDPVRADKRGRPWSSRRKVINGVLWILRTGAPWADLPSRYGNYKTVHRRYQNWIRDGVIEKLLQVLAKDLQERGKLDLKESFIDGSFVPAKKGGSRLGRPSVAKEPSSWQSSTAMVFLSPEGQKALRQLK